MIVHSHHLFRTTINVHNDSLLYSFHSSFFFLFFFFRHITFQLIVLIEHSLADCSYTQPLFVMEWAQSGNIIETAFPRHRNSISHYYRPSSSGMVSPVKNIASRYLEALQETTPSRSPLSTTLKFNSNVKLAKKTTLESPDLDDLARQINIETPRIAPLVRTSFDAPSATVSSFKTTPRSESRDSRGTRTSTTSRQQLSSATKCQKDSRGYEYLCRILAIKNWLQIVLGEEITQSPAELISYVQNGIHLAKLANIFLPTKKAVYTNDSRLEFRHTENINRFFRLLQYLDIPDLFRFELTDLYDAKDVPKVWFCLHAMSYIINQMDSTYPTIENLVGSLEFDDGDLRTANRALSGHSLPNFASADGSNASPGSNSYMNKTLTFKSPSKIPPRPKLAPEAASDDPFREKNPTAQLPKNYELNSVRRPDLSIPVYNTPQTSPVPDSSRYSSSSPELDNYVTNVIKLQALSKGAIFRYKMFVDKIMLRSFDAELTTLFSVIRGNMSRKRSVHRHRDDLLLFEEHIVKLQSIARSNMLRRFLGYSFSTQDEQCVRRLQSVCRGSLLRTRRNVTQTVLRENEQKITCLQSVLRAKSIYSKVSTIAPVRTQIEGEMVKFQSACRRFLYQRQEKNGLVSQVSGKDLLEIQAIIRGGQTRNKVRVCLRTLGREKFNLRELQSIARGGVLRTRLCNNVLITLLGEDIKMNEMFAKARGNAIRKRMQYKKAVLEYVAESEVIPIQSIFRGVLARFKMDMDLEDVYEHVNSIITLQARIRANAVTSDIKQMNTHYNDNIDKVIQAQSLIRSKYTQNAYKALINMKNPPVSVVRKFAYLLSDSGLDYQEEMELNKLKDVILEKSKNNEDLELQIENLDIKLSLLDKNKISIEDFMRQNNKFQAYKPARPKTMNVKALENLNKSAKKRIELYQTMFYFLQTRPSYWLRLYKQHPSPERDNYIKSLEYQVLLIFPILKGSVNNHSREEFFFLKFICSLMEMDMTRSRNIADITKAKSALWLDFMADFNNHVYQRMHLKLIFGRMVTRIIDDDELTFESDPSKIYAHMRHRETRVHGSSSRKEEISPQEAIKDQGVSAAFVRNLIALREAATDSMEVIQKSVSEIPLHVRILAKQAYDLSVITFPDQNEQQHLAVAGVVLTKHYFSSIMLFPENFGYSTKDAYTTTMGLPDRRSENLKYLSRVLLQVFSMKPFSDNFMKPLNDYVLSSVNSTRALIKEVINVKLLEVEFEMNDYDDIVSHLKPQLTMKVSDMIAVEKMVTNHLEVVAPSFDDQLHSIATELYELVNSADDFVTLTEIGSLTLTLSPKTQEDTVADSKVRTLLSQAKRCLLYIIRVQDGDDLLELFIHGIKPVHEEKFREIIQSESDGSKTSSDSNPYRKSFLGDMTKMSYIDLKKLSLKVILQLESLHIVTRKNSFQELLNLIVVDIKTKDSQRVSRKMQLKIANQTVNKLLEKEKFLKRQLDDYNSHIDQILGEMQLRPKEKKLFNIIPVFSKQYFYHRQLKKNNRLPKFGSYKYSAKKLLEQNVVKDFSGMLQAKFASSSKLDFMFSCHKLGSFVIEAANGSVNIPGACTTITLDQLLDHQYEKKKTWDMFDGMVTFDTENLSALIFRKFYDIKRD